jgi:hypothetical protein
LIIPRELRVAMGRRLMVGAANTTVSTTPEDACLHDHEKAPPPGGRGSLNHDDKRLSWERAGDSYRDWITGR